MVTQVKCKIKFAIIFRSFLLNFYHENKFGIKKCLCIYSFSAIVGNMQLKLETEACFNCRVFYFLNCQIIVQKISN